MTDRPFSEDREPVKVTMPLPPATSRLVARQLRREASAARARGDLVQATKLEARADALCPLGPPGVAIGSRA